MKKNKSHNERTGQDMKALGALGGKANTHQHMVAAASAGGRAVWANLTPKQRSEENARRARLAWITKRKKGIVKKALVLVALVWPFIGAAAIPPDSISTKIVALTLLGEARGEGWSGMYFVACVIQQRSIERGKDCAKICVQPLQFSCWNGIHGDGLKLIKRREWLFESKSAPDALRLARFIMKGGKLERERIGFANHFCAINANP